MKIYPLLLLFLFFAASHQVKSQTVDTLIETGACKLHFKIIKGNITQVLFESGGGLTTAQWDSVVAPVHQATGATIITYDRQGFGGSGIDTSNYTILNEIKGLEIGLRKLGYNNKPTVLVCHSLGAFYGRVYASRNANVVQGIIMLDPRIPSYSDMAFAKRVNNSIDLLTLKKEGLGFYYVLVNMVGNSDFARKASLKPNLPILTVMAERGPFDLVQDNERFQSEQRKFVQEGSNRTLIYAKGSSHNIPLDKPRLVINEIIDFCEKILRR